MISLITTYKNRSHHIIKSIPTWINQNRKDFEIIIVDYDSKDDITPILEKYALNCLNLIHLKCSVYPIFHLSHARNIGSKHANSEYCLFVDIDTVLDSAMIDFLYENLDSSRYFAAINSDIKRDIINGGLIAAPLNTHHKICGFNEYLTGWGYEDIDYKQRLEKAGLTFYIIPPLLYKCIDHSDYERIQCYSEEKDVSWTKNRQIALQQWNNFNYGNCSNVIVRRYGGAC